MHERKKIFYLLVVVLFLGQISLAVARKPVVLKIATLAPEGSAWMRSFHAMAAEVKEETNGEVIFKAYTGGVMGSASDLLRKMRIGQIHGGGFTAGEASAVYPDLRAMSTSLLFRDYQEVDYVLGKIKPGFEKELEKRGYVALAWVETGFVYIMSREPIGGIDDLKGKKAWIPEGDPIGRATFEAAGVSPIPLVLADVLTGLQTGLIDTVCNSPVGSIALQWFTRVKYLTDIPLLYSYGLLMMEKRHFQRIPLKYQPLVKEIVRRHFREMNRKTRKDNRKAMETLKKHGIGFIPVTPTHYQELVELMGEVKERLLREKVFTTDILKIIQDYVATYRGKQ